MKREVIFRIALFLVCVLILTEVFTFLTLRIISDSVEWTCAIVIIMGYFATTLPMDKGIEGIIYNIKSKYEWSTFVLGVDMVIMITTFFLLILENLSDFSKNITVIISIIIFILLFVFGGIAMKIEEKNKKENKD